MFSPFRHAAVPAMGAVALVVPFIELCKPGQPAPYDVFPFIALGLVAIAAVIAYEVVRRRPSTGSSEGGRIP
jgi:hypothetical protein